MRIAILDTYYAGALEACYEGTANLSDRPYREQLNALLDCGFGTSRFMSVGLQRAGWDAEDFIVNEARLQCRWARENGMGRGWLWWPRARRDCLLRIAGAQIRAFRPDVLYVQNVYWPSPAWVRETRRFVRCVVGQVGSKLEPEIDVSAYDLIISSIPSVVEEVRKRGARSEYVRIAFGSGVQEPVGAGVRDVPVCFIGTLSPREGVHGAGTALLEYVAARCPLAVWGQGIESVDKRSPLRAVFRGPAWGRDVYRIFGASKIVLNRHATWAGPDANNMRLYEATGMGALLLTDAKRNLNDLFIVGEEVVAYRSKFEAAEWIERLLAHEEERANIARRGQSRTLRDHTYDGRMRELDAILRCALRSCGRKLEARQELAAATWDPGAMSTWECAEAIGRKALGHGVAERITRRAVRAARRVNAGVRRRLLKCRHGEEGGWTNVAIAARQRELVDRQLLEFYAGGTVAPFRALRDTCVLLGGDVGRVLEIGCASGYNYEVLQSTIGRIRYIGTDLSLALLSSARAEYPGLATFCSDSTRIPLPSSSFDTVVSGCVLLHVQDWRGAVSETARLARAAVVFHRTPVSDAPASVGFEKLAYGIPVREWAFNRCEFEAELEANALVITGRVEVGKHRVPKSREIVDDVTYVCRLGGNDSVGRGGRGTPRNGEGARREQRG